MSIAVVVRFRGHTIVPEHFCGAGSAGGAQVQSSVRPAEWGRDAHSRWEGWDVHVRERRPGGDDTGPSLRATAQPWVRGECSVVVRVRHDDGCRVFPRSAIWGSRLMARQRNLARQAEAGSSAPLPRMRQLDEPHTRRCVKDFQVVPSSSEDSDDSDRASNVRPRRQRRKQRTSPGSEGGPMELPQRGHVADTDDHGGRGRCFYLDYCFMEDVEVRVEATEHAVLSRGPGVGSIGLFPSIGLPLVYFAMSRYHTCLIAYGPRRSGKSHNMFGRVRVAPTVCRNAGDIGLIHRAANELLLLMSTQRTAARAFDLHISFFEVEACGTFNERAWQGSGTKEPSSPPVIRCMGCDTATHSLQGCSTPYSVKGAAVDLGGAASSPQLRAWPVLPDGVCAHRVDSEAVCSQQLNEAYARHVARRHARHAARVRDALPRVASDVADGCQWLTSSNAECTCPADAHVFVTVTLTCRTATSAVAAPEDSPGNVTLWQSSMTFVELAGFSHDKRPLEAVNATRLLNPANMGDQIRRRVEVDVDESLQALHDLLAAASSSAGVLQAPPCPKGTPPQRQALHRLLATFVGGYTRTTLLLTADPGPGEVTKTIHCLETAQQVMRVVNHPVQVSPICVSETALASEPVVAPLPRHIPEESSCSAALPSVILHSVSADTGDAANDKAGLSTNPPERDAASRELDVEVDASAMEMMDVACAPKTPSPLQTPLPSTPMDTLGLLLPRDSVGASCDGEPTLCRSESEPRSPGVVTVLTGDDSDSTIDILRLRFEAESVRLRAAEQRALRVSRRLPLHQEIPGHQSVGSAAPQDAGPPSSTLRVSCREELIPPQPHVSTHQLEDPAPLRRVDLVDEPAVEAVASPHRGQVFLDTSARTEIDPRAWGASSPRDSASLSAEWDMDGSGANGADDQDYDAGGDGSLAHGGCEATVTDGEATGDEAEPRTWLASPSAVSLRPSPGSSLRSAEREDATSMLSTEDGGHLPTGCGVASRKATEELERRCTEAEQRRREWQEEKEHLLERLAILEAMAARVGAGNAVDGSGQHGPKRGRQRDGAPHAPPSGDEDHAHLAPVAIPADAPVVVAPPPPPRLCLADSSLRLHPGFRRKHNGVHQHPSSADIRTIPAVAPTAPLPRPMSSPARLTPERESGPRSRNSVTRNSSPCAATPYDGIEQFEKYIDRCLGGTVKKRSPTQWDDTSSTTHNDRGSGGMPPRSVSRGSSADSSWGGDLPHDDSGNSSEATSNVWELRSMPSTWRSQRGIQMDFPQVGSVECSNDTLSPSHPVAVADGCEVTCVSGSTPQKGVVPSHPVVAVSLSVSLSPLSSLSSKWSRMEHVGLAIRTDPALTAGSRREHDVDVSSGEQLRTLTLSEAVQPTYERPNRTFGRAATPSSVDSYFDRTASDLSPYTSFPSTPNPGLSLIAADNAVARSPLVFCRLDSTAEHSLATIREEGDELNAAESYRSLTMAEADAHWAPRPNSSSASPLATLGGTSLSVVRPSQRSPVQQYVGSPVPSPRSREGIPPLPRTPHHARSCSFPRVSDRPTLQIQLDLEDAKFRVDTAGCREVPVDFSDSDVDQLSGDELLQAAVAAGIDVPRLLSEANRGASRTR